LNQKGGVFSNAEYSSFIRMRDRQVNPIRS
jgi:hypothetical protein